MAARGVRALQRRESGQQHSAVILYGASECHVKDRTAFRQNPHLALSPKEFELFRYFMENAGEIVTREMLLRDVLNATATRREAVDLPAVDLAGRTPGPLANVVSKHAGWLVVMGVIVVAASLAAVLPRIVSAGASWSIALTDPLPLTILVILAIGLGSLLVMERADRL